MNRDRSAHWDKVYGEKSDADLSWHQDSPAVSLELARLAGLSADWAVIDVGGGTSRLADRMIDLGVRDLTVVDLSRGALEASRKRLGARGAGIGWVAATEACDWLKDEGKHEQQKRKRKGKSKTEKEKRKQ